MYTYEEALKHTLEYFNGNDLAANVFLTKYALKDNDDNILELTPNDMHKRLANELARIERKKFKKPYTEEFIFDYLKDFKQIIPQGSPMFGIGNKYKRVSLSNCFVVESPFDSYGGICHTDEQIAQISKRRGGIGYDISTLRPRGTPVNNSASTTTGAVSFMHRFSHTGREVGQEGRRGAQMITISVHHPDIEEFACIKNDDISVTGANISVRLTDEFLQAVTDDVEYEQRWPVDDHSSPIISRMVSARKVWKTIIHSAWLRAEPGLLFWDNIIRESPADCYSALGFKTISTNPCGELPICADDSCRLLAILLFCCVKNPFTKDAYFDYDMLYELAIIAQRLMDDIIDLEIEAINGIIQKIKADDEPEHIKQNELNTWERILEKCKSGRRTGTGTTGLGDTFAALGLKYGSKASIDVADKIYKTFKLGCYRSSVDMAKEIGAFPIWSAELEQKNPFFLRIKEEDSKLYADMQRYGRRNIACLTNAPTGSTSIEACLEVIDKKFFGSTSGIEPNIMMCWTRRKKINPGDKDVQVDYIDKLGDKWQEFEVSPAGIEAWKYVTGKNDITKSPYYGSCADNIDWIKRVELQSVIQKHIDHSISSTINLPNDATEKEVANIYEAAWKYGCKGVTVYRQGCRDGVLISDKNKNTVFPEERPKELPCDVHHITVQGQQYFVLVGLLNNRPYEVFAGKNGLLTKKVKSGIISKKKKDFYAATFEGEETLSPITQYTDELEECVTRLTSGLLRVGTDMHFIVRQLEKVGERQTEIHSFARSVSRALKKYIPDGTEEKGTCPNCEMSALYRQEGCMTCRNCGYSKCL